MNKNTQILAHFIEFRSGTFQKPGILADTLYLQAVHFSRTGLFDTTVAPTLRYSHKLDKHLLQDGDVLFAAKGLSNFAVVYQEAIGKAVASSSFIILRIAGEYKKSISPAYLAWALNQHKEIPLLHAQQMGTTIASVSIAQLKQLTIAIPPADLQQKILDVERLRQKEKEIINKLQQQKDKLIQQLLTRAATK